MATSHSTKRYKHVDPATLPQGFNLSEHAARRCFKKYIAGKTKYFGSFNDPAGAWREYKAYMASLETDADSLAECCNQYLNGRRKDVNNPASDAPIGNEHFADLVETAGMVCDFFSRDRGANSIIKGEWLEFQKHIEARYSLNRRNNVIGRTSKYSTGARQVTFAGRYSSHLGSNA